MKNMKKILAIALVFIMTFGLSVPALATGNDQAAYEETYFNEYDYILSIERASSEELSEMGLTKEQATEIISTFMNALQERAALPDETLLGYGYTQDEIRALRTFNNSRSTVSADTMRAITGTCTGQITASWMTERDATFMYRWEWDHAPVMMLKDSAAMRWIAVDEYADEKDVIISSKSGNINYYWNGSKRFSRSGTWENNTMEFNAVNLQFEESENFQSSTTITEEAYAGDGHIKVSVKLKSTVVAKLEYIKVAALYGHTTVGPSFPSISLSPPNSISIGFSGSFIVDSIAPAQVMIEIGSSSSKPIVTDLLDV